MIFQNDERNNSLQMASAEQKKSDENVLRLVEEQKVNFNLHMPLKLLHSVLICY